MMRNDAMMLMSKRASTFLEAISRAGQISPFFLRSALVSIYFLWSVRRPEVKRGEIKRGGGVVPLSIALVYIK